MTHWHASSFATRIPAPTNFDAKLLCTGIPPPKLASSWQTQDGEAHIDDYRTASRDESLPEPPNGKKKLFLSKKPAKFQKKWKKFRPFCPHQGSRYILVSPPQEVGMTLELTNLATEEVGLPPLYLRSLASPEISALFAKKWLLDPLPKQGGRWVGPPRFLGRSCVQNSLV